MARIADPLEGELVEAARKGDKDAFRRVVEPYGSELHAHCYRMLASPFDADDALQETLLRAWRAIATFRGDEHFRAWLFKIASNVCLNALRTRTRRRRIESGEPLGPGDEPGVPLPESAWVQPYPDDVLGLQDGYASPESRYEQREAVELAFIAALQHLTPPQRAALLLRDVLGFSAKEAAGALNMTVASVNSSLQRARRTVDKRIPAPSQQTTLRALGDERVRSIVKGFIDAWERGDVASLVTMLAEDATFSMPPYAASWRGRDVIASFAAEPVHRYLPVRANGQAANAAYRWDERKATYAAEALEILTLDGATVKAMTAFMMPDLFPLFGLPAELPGRTK